MQTAGKVFLVMLIALCLSFSVNIFLYWRVVEYAEWLQSLQDRINELSIENLSLRESLEILNRTLEYHPTNASVTGNNWIYMVGVTTTSTGAYEGEILRIYAKLIDGSGNVFIATNPKIGIELQRSAETAFTVACQITNASVASIDCMLIVTANKSIDVVDGPSAGAAITVLLSLMLKGKEPRRDVVITGEIYSDGTIGRVGGIIEKAMAAAMNGATLFLVPEGQSVATIYIQEVIQRGPIRIIRYIPQTVNVQEYLREKGYNIKVVEVSNIMAALQYFEAKV
ncbi:MAG: S16 family serine protease [Nitrososphaerota archaeon]|nr:hypothetical protein [Candidatus Bathyarchaeota archaeon]MDW8048591.1 S16 family serine protease [Nitrososphaerota archaeon]